jgi:hypothetical protein
MKRLLVVFSLLVVPLPAAAQARSIDGLGSVEGQHVFVIDSDSREWQGKLIKVSADSLEIDGESGVRRFELGRVRRVDSDGDSVHDGLIKGAIFGGLMAAIFSPSNYRGQAMIGGAVAYGLIGLGMDALNSSKHTVYRGAAAPAAQVAMKVSW